MFNVTVFLFLLYSYDLYDPIILEWRKLLDKFGEEFGLGLAADYFTWAKYLPTRGSRVIKEIFEKMKEFFRNQIKDHGDIPSGRLILFYSILSELSSGSNTISQI